MPSRMEAIKTAGGVAKFPPPPLCEYMVGYLFDAGPTQPGSGGATPLCHSEIAAWQSNTGIELDAWQASTLRALSVAYVNQSRLSVATDCPPPWAPELKPVERVDVSKQVQNAMQTLMRTRPKR